MTTLPKGWYPVDTPAPAGWFPLGWHAKHRARGQRIPRLVLSWTHFGDNGLPLWETPIREQLAAPEHHTTAFGEQQALFTTTN